MYFCSSDALTHIIQACGLNENFIAGILSPWNTLMGGWFGPIFWGVIVLAVYVKYRNAMLALLGGIIPMTAIFAIIPSTELGLLAMIAGTAVGLALYQLVHSRVETPQV